jgi:hypothetical protein
MTKDIKLKLTAKQLGSLVYILKELPNTPTKERTEKVARSVIKKVSLKVQKKHLEAQHEHTDLFTKPKSYSFSLELVEAHFLEQYTLVMINYPLNTYDRNVIGFIQSTLNQKLA